jgi:hypothetical protein
MNYLDKTKLTVVLLEEDKETPTRVSFNHVDENPSEAAVLELAAIMTDLAPANTVMSEVVKVEETIYHN